MSQNGQQKIMKIIDELDDLAQRSFSMAFLGKVILPEEALFNIINDLREIIPAELRDAELIRERAQQILNQANKEAQVIKQAAQDRARAMAREHEIAKLAEVQARELSAQARVEAQEIIEGANQYATELLAELEQKLNANLGTVRNGLKVLKDRGAK